VGNRAARCEALRRLLDTLPADEQGRRSYHVDDLAAQLGCCRRTVSSLLAELEAAGELERGAPRGTGGAPFVVLAWDANKCTAPNAAAELVADEAASTEVEPSFWDASETPVQHVEMPESADVIPMHRVYTPAPCPVEPPADDRPEREPTPADLAAVLADAPGLLAAPSPLRDLVAEGLDLYDDAPIRGKRSRAALVRWHAAQNASGVKHPREQVTACYRAELMRRSVASWTPSKIRARLRLVEHLADKAEHQDDPSAAWWRFEAGLLRDEQRWHPAEPGRKPRAVVEALPNLRVLGERHQEQQQARLWQGAAHEIERWRATLPVRLAPPRAGVFPPAAPVAPKLPIGQAGAERRRVLIESLRARQRTPAAAAE
jgi:hypothetical protein